MSQRRGWAIVVLVGVLALAVPTGALGAPADAPIEQRRGGSVLPTEIVTWIYQDRTGFLWIGTREGLGLFDGETFTLFDHDVADPNSLSDNTVRTIYEDRDGNLWVGTNAAGLDRLDRATWTFEHFRHDSADPASISHDSVNAILQDRSGAIWVGTQIGLNRFDPKTGKFERILAEPGDPDRLSHDYVYAIHEDRDGYLWIGTVGGGLNRLDPESGRFTRFVNDPADPRSLSNDGVFAIAEDASGSLWIGTNAGLNRLDRSRGTFQRFEDPPEQGGLSAALVTSLIVDRSGTLWIGTWGGGVNTIDTMDEVPTIEPRPAAGVVGENERVVTLLQDRSGTIWVGTWGEGLKPVRQSLGLFDVIGPVTGGEPGELGDATAVFEDDRGRLWVGTWGRGIHRRDSGGGSFQEFYRGPEGARALPTVLAIEQDRHGRVWAGTMNGLFRLDPDSERFTSFLHDPADPSSLGPGYTVALHGDERGDLWVGVGEGGLNALREGRKGFDRFVHDADDAGSISANYVTAIAEDHRGTLWVGTRSGGLNSFDRESGRFRRYLPDPRDERSISHHHVTSILEGEEGVLWIGTSGGGLNRLDVAIGDGPGTITRFTVRDGLADDNVMGIATDRDGSLWLATRSGLSRFDPESGAFASFGIGDGLPASQFNPGAVATGPDRLYFGGTKGVTVVRRDTPFPTLVPSPTVLRSIRTLDGPVVGDQPPWNLERLEIPYGEVLTFEFTVLDFGESRRHRHAYRLEGVRDDWIEIGSRREITFTDLDPGKYRLHVKGRNDQGVWSEASTVLEIEVVPPFWMTWWFRGALIVGAVSLGFVAHRVRTAALEKRNRELQALKNQRERALADARSSENALHVAYGRLRDLTRRLEAAKEEERKRIARELHDEMGQALTAAKINLQILHGIDDRDIRAQRIVDTVGLVDRMISHVRTLSLDLRPPLLDELGVVAAVKGYLEAQSRRTGIEIGVEADEFPPEIPTDVAIVAFRVVQEAITNMLRHAGATRSHVTMRHNPGWLDLSIRDDGKGFDVDEAFERASAGHHLGLLGIRERVQALGGEVEILSSPGRGAELHVRVPLGG